MRFTSKNINTEYLGHGMGRMIAWSGALLSQQRHSLPSSALYSSLQNIIAHQAYVLKVFLRRKNKYFEKKRTTEIYWP
jgi:hypothetical protein